MTRHGPIASDTPATREHGLAVMAERILDDYAAGKRLIAVPGVEWEFYLPADWNDAAQYAADSQDFSDLEHMLTKESIYQGWMRLPEREQDAWGDFDSYFDERSRARVFRTMETANLMVGQFCADMLAGVRS